jgi:hypothetical protein
MTCISNSLIGLCLKKKILSYLLRTSPSLWFTSIWIELTGHPSINSQTWDYISSWFDLSSDLILVIRITISECWSISQCFKKSFESCGTITILLKICKGVQLSSYNRYEYMPPPMCMSWTITLEITRHLKVNLWCKLKTCEVLRNI